MADAMSKEWNERQLARRAETPRKRFMRLGDARAFGWMAWRRMVTTLAAWRAEAEMHAMDERELHDLGLGRGSIAYAARHGRERGE